MRFELTSPGEVVGGHLRVVARPAIPLQYARLEQLYAIQSALAEQPGIEEACDALLEVATRSLRVRTAVLIDAAQELHRALLWSAPGLRAAAREGAVARAREVLAYLSGRDLGDIDGVDRAAELPGGVAARSVVPRHFVTLPLVVHGLVLGVFQLEGAVALDERDLLFVNMVVNQLAVALDRHHVQRRLEESRAEVERANQRLRDLQATSEAALEGTTLDDSLSAVLRTLRPMFSADAAAVLLSSADGNTLRHRASVGFDEFDGHEISIGASAAGRIAARGAAMCFDELGALDDVSADLVANRIYSLIGAPLRARGRLIGVVYVASRSPREFADEELQLLELVADRIGIIIEHAALYDEALAAIRARDVVMSVVSHDLMNPLYNVQLWTQLAQTGKPHLIKPVSVIKRSIDVMIRLVNDLRDVGSIEAGHLSIQRRPEDAHGLVRDALEGVRDAAARKHLRLHAPPPTPTLLLDCDRVRVIQVLTNLLSNAIKFTPAGGSVTISMAEAEPGTARITVADTGGGIAEQDLSRVFDRYWQAADTAHLGTGLGLAIARGIVDAHGGTMTVESRVGEGTTLTFTLPLAQGAVPGGAAR